MSKFSSCPECGGELYLEGIDPDWDLSGDNEYYELVCSNCGYSEDADWFDPEDEE